MARQDGFVLLFSSLGFSLSFWFRSSGCLPAGRFLFPKGSAADSLQAGLSMPGNEVADKVHNFFEQGNSSQVQRQPQLASGSWPVRNGHLWVGNQRQTESPLSSNSSNYDINQSDSGRANGRESSQMPLGINLTQLTLRPQTSGNQHPNLNGFVHGRQGFQTRQNQAEFLGDDTLSNQHNLALGGLSFLEQQQGNAPGNGSASARTSERLEVAESPVNFNFLGGQQQLMRGQQPGMPQPRPGEQLGLNDMQLWQQQLMFKQIQEHQRQQQLQQLDQESRELNRMNQFSTIARQPAGDQLPALINGTPIHDASNCFWPSELMAGDSKVPSTSQMSMVGYMSRMQRGGSSALQGIPSGVHPSDDHGQVLRSTGFVPQQLEQSFYGTPVANMRGGFNQYSHLQGTSHEPVGMLTKPSGNQLEKPPMPSAFNNSFQVDRSAAFQDQVNMQGTSLVSKQGFHGKNILGQPPLQGLNTGFQPESFHQVGSLARNSSVQEFQGRQHQAGWMSNLQEKATNEFGSSHGSVSLDATEEKILFSSDDNPWDAPIDGSGIIAGGYGNPSESAEYFNAFPSIQSGTWSALMQSAVAEASSSDTGLHDEWSGLSYQKAEVSTGHQPATLSDSAVQQKDWVDKNLHSSSSLTSRSFPLFDDRNMNRSGNPVPGYQQPSIKFSCEQSERLQPDASLEATQEPSKEANQWLSHSSQPKSRVEGSHLVQPPSHLGNAWPGPSYEQLEGAAHSRGRELNAQDMHGSWVHHQSQSSYNIDSQPCDKPNGWNMNESLMPNGDATLKIHDSGNTMQHSENNDLKMGMHMERDHDGMWKAGDNRAASSFSNLTGGFEQVKSGIGSHHVTEEASHMNNFTAGPNSNSVKTNQETNRQRQSSHQLDHGKHVGNSSLRNKGDDSEANYQQIGNKETSSDSYNSNQSHHINTGRMRENSWLNANESCSSGSGNQKSMGQGGQKAPISRRFQFHPMGSLGVNMEPVDTTKQVRHSQTLSRQIMGGSKTAEQGHSGYSNFVSHVSNNAINMEKGHLPEIQENVIRPAEEPSRGLPPQHDSTVSSSDGSAGYYSQNRRPVQTCQNMLQLFNKVDQSRENHTHFGSSDRMPEGEVSDASVSHRQHNQSSVSQGFGLRLAPPSQRLPVPNHAFSSQNSSPTVNDLNSRHFNSETGERSQTSASVQPLSHEASHRDHWDKKPSISGQTSSETQPLKSAALSSYASPYQRNQLQHQQMCTTSAEIVKDQPDNVSFSRLASQQRDTHDTHNRIVVDRSVQASLPGTASRILPSNRIHPLDTNQPVGTNSSFGRVSGQHLPVLESVPVPHPSATLGSFTTNLHNVWTNVPTQQTLAGPPHNNPPNFSQSISPSKSNLERTWVQKQDGQGISKMGNSSEFVTGSISSHRFAHAEDQLGRQRSLQQMPTEKTHQHPKTAGAPQGQESAAKIFQDDNSVSPDSLVTNPHHQVLDRGRYGKDSVLVPQTEHASLRNHTISNRDIEAFGRSLKQSHASHQSYSLLQQVQAMKGVGTDPNNRVGKRFKGSDSGSDSQQVSANAGEQSFDGHCTIVRDVVDKELNAASLQKSFSSREDQNTKFPSQLVRGDVSSQNMYTFGQNDSTNCSSQLNTSPARSENPQINPRMAPSWFEQFGTFKNGKMVPMHDQRKAETAYQRFFSGKVSENSHTHIPVEQVNAFVAAQVGSASQCTATALVASESFSPPLSLSSEVPDQSLSVLIPKKRKNETMELVQWHKEVIDGSQRLLNISMAEQDWAQAANRLVEKVEDEVEMIEDGQPILRPKRRLILTTQLMQQILRPVPPAVLSSDAAKFHETVAYFVAKLQLGDACNLISSSKSDSRMPTANGNQTSEKLKTSERVVGDQYFSKAVEDFIGRARKLETDLLRLDKTSSILDLRLECQELEKFSVMNRFAIFHGRSQSDVTETSSSANAAAGMSPHKTCPQRYVTPVSTPRNLPQGVQCLSL